MLSWYAHFNLCTLSRFDSGGVASVLDDKSHLQGTRDRYRAYEVETPWDYISEEKAGELESCGNMEAVMEELHPGRAEFDLMYDDEYDDTYDSHNVGAADDANDELFVVQRLVGCGTELFHGFPHLRSRFQPNSSYYITS